MTRLTFYEDEHKYLTDEGIEVPSVTTILGLISAQGYSQIPQATVEYAAKRGKLVHECLELYDYGLDFEDMPIVTPETHGYLRAYLAFMRDYKATWTDIEEVVWEQTDGYCGTVDRAGYIDGKFVILDIKTNSNPTPINKVTVCAQTWAYAEALGKPEAKRYALYLKGNTGQYNLMDCEKYEEKGKFTGKDVFYRCLNLYQDIELIKRNVGRKKL